MGGLLLPLADVGGCHSKNELSCKSAFLPLQDYFFLSVVFSVLRAASNSSPSPSPSSILSCASAKGLKIPGFQTGVSSLQQTLKLQCSGCRRAAGDPEELQLREQLPGPWLVLDPLGSARFPLQGAQ